MFTRDELIIISTLVGNRAHEVGFLVAEGKSESPEEDALYAVYLEALVRKADSMIESL